MALRFRLEGEPITWKRPVWRHGNVYSPNRPIERAIRLQLREQFIGNVLQGSLRVEITFYFKRPSSHFEHDFIRRADAATWYDRKVDLDNLNKLVFDSMSGLIYHDDSQIVSLETSKRYSDLTSGYTEISIRAVN